MRRGDAVLRATALHALNGTRDIRAAIRPEDLTPRADGAIAAVVETAEYRGRDRFVGLHSERWTLEQGKPAAIRYLVVDTTNWLPGRKVLISPSWIERVSWTELKIITSHTREAIKAAPEFTSVALITRQYESRLHEHYERRGYWLDELVRN